MQRAFGEGPSEDLAAVWGPPVNGPALAHPDTLDPLPSHVAPPPLSWSAADVKSCKWCGVVGIPLDPRSGSCYRCKVTREPTTASAENKREGAPAINGELFSLGASTSVVVSRPEQATNCSSVLSEVRGPGFMSTTGASTGKVLGSDTSTESALADPVSGPDYPSLGSTRCAGIDNDAEPSVAPRRLGIGAYQPTKTTARLYVPGPRSDCEIQDTSYRPIQFVYAEFAAPSTEIDFVAAPHDAFAPKREDPYCWLPIVKPRLSKGKVATIRRPSALWVLLIAADWCWRLSTKVPPERPPPRVFTCFYSPQGHFIDDLAFGDYRDEFKETLIRMSFRVDKPVPEKTAKLPPDLARFDFRGTFSNPISPRPFVRASRDWATAMQNLEAAAAAYEMSPTGPFIDNLDRAEAQCQEATDAVFSAYARAMGLVFRGTAVFSKRVADAALSGAIGSVGTPGCGRFIGDFGDLHVDLDMSVPDQASVAFGLYMARKGFTVPKVRAKKDALIDQVTRLVTDPNVVAPLSFSQSYVKDRMLEVFRRLLALEFSDAAAFRATASLPNCGKACLERSRKRGGKRAAMFDEPNPFFEFAVSSGHQPSFGTDSLGNAVLLPAVTDEEISQLADCLPTQPEVILSGGKLRGISKTSVRASRFAWINEWAFGKVRKCAWSVAGRSVADWIAGSELDLCREEDVWVSGDLKAATDLLSSDFMETFVNHVAEQIYPGDTRTRTEMLQSSCKAVLGSPTLIGTLQHLGTQKRGQLMASDFSFPVLCLIGFLIGTATHHRLEHLLGLDDDAFRAEFYGRSDFGVNGDDFVTRGRDGDVQASWIHSVEATHGVPEPAKSPCDRRMFTINSELWRLTGDGRPVRVHVALPVMLASVLSREHRAADLKWILEFVLPVAPPGHRRYTELGLDLVLLLDVPRSLGGLGLLDPYDTPSHLRAPRVAYGMLRAPLDASRKLRGPSTEAQSSVWGGAHGRGMFAVSSCRGNLEYVGAPTVGWFKREDLARLALSRHGVRRLSEWTLDTPARIDFESAFPRAVRDLLDRPYRALRDTLVHMHQMERDGFKVAVYRPMENETIIEPVETEIPYLLTSATFMRKVEAADTLIESTLGIGPSRPRVPSCTAAALSACSVTPFAFSHGSRRCQPDLVDLIRAASAREEEEDRDRAEASARSHL